MINLYQLYEQKINAPTFIYSIVNNGKHKFISGHSANHETYMLNGIQIDKHIPKQAIEELNKIKEIEPRSSCEGTDKDRPTYFIFRSNKSAKDIIDKLNSYKNIKAGWDIGNDGKERIGITTTLWYSKDPDKFIKWWNELPNIIRNCL